MISTIPGASTLTTFSSLAFNRPSVLSVGGGVGGTGVVVPPGKGLRGVLDNIVTEGMRVAVEVRNRMDEAQKEMEKNATQRPDEEEEE